MINYTVKYNDDNKLIFTNKHNDIFFELIIPQEIDDCTFDLKDEFYQLHQAIDFNDEHGFSFGKTKILYKNDFIRITSPYNNNDNFTICLKSNRSIFDAFLHVSRDS